MLCIGITSSLKVIDPVTMQRGEINEDVYFRHQRPAIMTARMAIEFMVLDVEPTGLSAGKMNQAEVTLARSRDLGRNDVQLRTLTHLGNILSAGDVVMGYDMTAAVYNEADTKEWPKLVLPDVIIVKKVYPEMRRRNRMWKLRALIKQEEEGTYRSMHRGGDQEKDYEQFLEDVDMDAELRQRVNVYKDPSKFRITDEGQVVAPPRMAEVAVEEEEEDVGTFADGGLIGEFCRLVRSACPTSPPLLFLLFLLLFILSCSLEMITLRGYRGNLAVQLSPCAFSDPFSNCEHEQAWRKCSTTWCWERKKK